ncbi:MAG TPA: hypothetical protein VF713_08040 [Thermoanaerobaculia bacterium]
MKKVAVLIALVAILIGPAGFAACPDQAGPYCLWFGCYYVFSFPTTSCASTSGSLTSTTLSCYSWPAYQITGTGYADYTMVVPTGMGGSHWSVEQYVDMNSTSHSDWLYAVVLVIHNGTNTYAATYFSHTGDQGALSCQPEGSGFFSAADGDTIFVETGGVNSTSSTMAQGTPLVFSD